MVREPSLAELARTALADASAATLVTAGCPTPGTFTVVPIEDRADGRPLVRLERSSTTVRLLVSCPVVTLSLPAPAPYRALDLVGPLTPCRSPTDGTRSHRLSLLPVVCGRGSAASRGEARGGAPRLVRAHGGDVLAVVPRVLDRYGIELAALGPDGVRRVRLDFPGGPVDHLGQVTTDLRILLTCRCRG